MAYLQLAAADLLWRLPWRGAEGVDDTLGTAKPRAGQGNVPDPSETLDEAEGDEPIGLFDGFDVDIAHDKAAGKLELSAGPKASTSGPRGFRHSDCSSGANGAYRRIFAPIRCRVLR